MVLRGVDLHVAAGEFVVVVGPNGAGKTTCLRILATLARPTAGQVLLGGLRLPGEAVLARRLLGVVSHQPLLYGDLTAEENLRFYRRLYSLPAAARRVEEALEMVGLAERRRDLVRTFSRGMQQRLAIGRAVLHAPRILLFDEPHTGLDQDAAEMLDGILRRVASMGQAILMTSHDLSRAAELATRVDILSRGVVAASLSREELSPARLGERYREVTRG